MNKLDVVCVCGHSKNQHKANYKGSPDKTVCKVLEDESELSGWADRCMKYVPDNLSHIEELAKKKGLV